MRYFVGKLQLNKQALLLILVGTVVWSLTMVKSGWVYSFGVGFWGPNGHDGVWHIALINHLAKGSFDMPVFSGAPLKNYHIGFDLLLAAIHKVTFIPVHVLYFQVVPPLVALFMGLLVYRFVYLWQKSQNAAFWSTFFVYFSGSFGPFVTLIRGGEFGGESMFWAQQAISTLINPPFALSLVLLLAGCILLLQYNKQQTTKNLLLIALVFVVVGQVKIYAGILTLGGLLMAGIYQLVKEKRMDLLKLFALSLALFIVLFIPLNKGSSSLVVYQPFWFLENMMALSDRVGWPKFHEAMINYRYGDVWHKSIPAYLVAFAIFWVGNMGTRLIKELLLVKWLLNFKKISWVEVFFGAVIIGGVLLPMFFLQRGTPWNTIQFFYYSLTFSGVLAGIAFADFLKGKKVLVKYGSILTLIFLTLPTTYSTLKHYLPDRPPAKISNEELEALAFLEKQEDGTILTFPFDSYAAELALNNPPRPLYLYESTAYVAAFSGKSVYLEDEVNLNITGYDWRARRKKAEEFFASLDHGFVRSFLRESNIAYIYWVGGQRAKLGETQLGITQIFENSQVKIYSVD